MKAKDLKDAKVYKLKFGEKERPFTFDYNTLGELQELGYIEPAEAIIGYEMRNAKSTTALIYTCFVSGLMVEDEYAIFDMTRSEVGRLLGYYMMQDREHYQSLLKTLEEAMRSFFPEPKPEDKKVATKKANKDDEDPKN